MQASAVCRRRTEELTAHPPPAAGGAGRAAGRSRARASRGLPALALALVALAGCAASPPAQFYVMTPVAEADAPRPAAGRGGPALGVGPVKLPGYLDRPEIVSRTRPNALQIAEFDRWAEPVADNFTRVLGANLAVSARTDRVSLYPWPRFVPVDYQVVVEVDRFDAGPGGQVVLVARWYLLAGEGVAVVRSGRSVLSEPAAAGDYEAIAAAMSRVVATLGREIAAAIPAAPPARRG